jgi:broad specificity phosphatase PhoE
MTRTLVLVRHGEIVRPSDTSNFDRAPLSERGEEQMRELVRAWPVEPPRAIFTSPLRRSVESATILTNAFRIPLAHQPCLKEWTPDESDLLQDEYKALERRCWAELDLVPPSQESLAQAAARGGRCVREIAAGMEDVTAALVGHGTLFSLVAAQLKGERPTEAHKNSIGFAYAAVLEAGSDLRLVRDFRWYGPTAA